MNTTNLKLVAEKITAPFSLACSAFSHLASLPYQFNRVLYHCFHIGYCTFWIVAILSLFIGAVLALQTGFSLRSISGAHSFLGSIVGLSMARELGPIMTAFLVAGRVGSATAAELASMKVYNEVDALITMKLPPARILVLPRLVAILLMMPILTMFSNILGWFGGMIVSRYVSLISLDPATYWDGVKTYVDFESIKDGLVKAEIFGFTVVLICCHVGLNTKGGPREIGRAVTKGVVSSMFMILILDYFVTKFTL